MCADVVGEGVNPALFSQLPNLRSGQRQFFQRKLVHRTAQMADGDVPLPFAVLPVAEFPHPDLLLVARRHLALPGQQANVIRELLHHLRLLARHRCEQRARILAEIPARLLGHELEKNLLEMSSTNPGLGAYFKATPFTKS